MSGRDRISELPESLLTQILSYLPTNQSVQTSVLSTRWKNLYLSVPGLDLNCSLIRYDADEVFLTFIDKLLEFSPESSLFKVKIKCRNTMIDGFKDRIGTLINRGTHHLDVESSIYFEDDDSLYPIPIVDMMPMNLLTSKTLVYLKLASSGLMDPGVVFMPCLRFMHLEEVKWRVHLEKLLSGCPVLEELTLSRDMDDDYAIGNEEFTVMRVRSQSLKRFSVQPLRQARDYHSRVECTLEIDAPGLEHMSLGKDQFDRIVVKNLTSLLVVELDIKFFVKVGVLFNTWDVSKSNEIREFLNGISSVGHMIISGMTVHAFEHYSKAGIIPKFNNLSRLQAVFHSNLLQFLPAFLECFPNLKHLLLKVLHSEEMEEGEGLELTDVPRCVSSSLECVEIQEQLELEEGKMKATSYFLANSAVLKKLILSPTAYDPRNVAESEIWEKVNKLTKRSTRCEVIIRAIEVVVIDESSS
ncbi:F-box/FBD/LRR-repeat protein At1g13780 isoform X3 [Brassica rapa]|uniref:F-box/FBD/LRR-repeat protein At1g13780 isoform X3 n=1 Tax=Brassica campestris TaxID=3711 RepID=UPI00142E76EF|nr:F-box/FBD/LRR-repeat protein At1g13780 isoform X3 [Brassica rapa]